MANISVYLHLYEFFFVVRTIRRVYTVGLNLWAKKKHFFFINGKWTKYEPLRSRRLGGRGTDLQLKKHWFFGAPSLRIFYVCIRVLCSLHRVVSPHFVSPGSTENHLNLWSLHSSVRSQIDKHADTRKARSSRVLFTYCVAGETSGWVN